MYAKSAKKPRKPGQTANMTSCVARSERSDLHQTNMSLNASERSSQQQSNEAEREFLEDCLLVQKAYRLSLLEDNIKKNAVAVQESLLNFQSKTIQLHKEVSHLKEKLTAENLNIWKQETTAQLVPVANQLEEFKPTLDKINELARSLESYLHALPAHNVIFKDPDEFGQHMAQCLNLIEKIESTLRDNKLNLAALELQSSDISKSMELSTQQLTKNLSLLDETLKLAVTEISLRDVVKGLKS